MAKRAKPGGGDVQLVGEKAAARAVAAARTAFNDALAARDLAGIEAALCETASLVPGDEAELIPSRAAQLDAWRSIFSQAPDAHYVRSPARIEIAEDGRLAAETGRWRGGWSVDGLAVRYFGRYFAKWRLDGVAWRIDSEIFITLKRSTG